MSDFRLVVVYNTSTSEAARWRVAADLAMLGIFTAKSDPILCSASYTQVFMIKPELLRCPDMCTAMDRVNQMVANLYLENAVTLYGVFALQDCWRYATGIYYKRRLTTKPIENVFWSATYGWSDQFVSNIPDVDHFGYMLNPLVRMRVKDYSAAGHCYRGECS